MAASSEHLATPFSIESRDLLLPPGSMGSLSSSSSENAAKMPYVPLPLTFEANEVTVGWLTCKESASEQRGGDDAEKQRLTFDGEEAFCALWHDSVLYFFDEPKMCKKFFKMKERGDRLSMIQPRFLPLHSIRRVIGIKTAEGNNLRGLVLEGQTSAYKLTFRSPADGRQWLRAVERAIERQGENRDVERMDALQTAMMAPWKLFAAERAGEGGNAAADSSIEAKEYDGDNYNEDTRDAPGILERAWITKQADGIFARAHARFFALCDNGMLYHFKTEEQCQLFFSSSTTAAERARYAKKIDLVSAISLKDVSAGAGMVKGNAFCLGALQRKWTFTPAPEQTQGEFKSFIDLIAKQISRFNGALGQLVGDKELARVALHSRRPDQIAERARSCLEMFEREQYQPHTMTFKELRAARALRARVRQGPKGRAAVSTLTALDGSGALVAVRGLVEDGGGGDKAGEEVGGLGGASESYVGPGSMTDRERYAFQGPLISTSDSPITAPMPTSKRGWMRVGNKRMYGILANDGKLRFFSSAQDGEDWFASPFSPSSANLVRLIVDLAATLSVRKTSDGDGIVVTTPTKAGRCSLMMMPKITITNSLAVIGDHRYPRGQEPFRRPL